MINNKYIRLAIGVVAGMIVISVVAEAIELLVVLGVSGNSYETLRSDSSKYFEVRNQPYILVAKMGYTFFAAALAGLATAKIAGNARKPAIVALTVLQVGLLLWAGFISSMSTTGPREMWIGLCFAVAIGVNTGYKLLSKKSHNR